MQIDIKITNQSVAKIREFWPQAAPSFGIILGSGWSKAASEFEEVASLPYSKIEGLGPTRVAGHPGKLSWCRKNDLEVLIFQGRRHWYEGFGWTPVAIPLYLLKEMGAKSALLTNAAGGIRSDLRPGDIMLIEDHINMMGSNPLIGLDLDERFTDLTSAYNPEALDAIMESATSVGTTLYKGVYAALSGPSFETPAEIRALRSLGADAVGMSTVPEVILARTLGLHVTALSCISNYAAGIGKAPLSGNEVITVLDGAMNEIRKVIGICCSVL